MKSLVDKITSELTEFKPVVNIASSGSIYISFTGSKVREVRIADHAGHKLKRNVWELRSDAMTSRKNPSNRVYNFSAISQLIRDFK